MSYKYGDDSQDSDEGLVPEAEGGADSEKKMTGNRNANKASARGEGTPKQANNKLNKGGETQMTDLKKPTQISSRQTV